MAKTLKCSKCNRMFSGKKGLADHVAVKHTMASSKVPRARQNPISAPVATASVITTPTDGGVRLSGCDVVAQVSDISTFQPGAIVVGNLVTAAIFPRLKTVAAAFQRIRWLSLRFEVNPQFAANTSGGYVAAFIRDPADKPSGSDETRVRQMMSQAGAKVTSWWRGTTVQAKLPNGLLFVSSGVEEREYSPGSFYVVCTGKSSQKGNLFVTAHWEVQLSQACLESALDFAPEYKALMDLYLRKDYEGVFGKVSASAAWVQNPNQLISNIENGSKYQLPFPISVQDGVSDKEFSIKVANYIIFKSGKNELTLATDLADTGMSNNALDNNMIIPAGTVLKLVSVDNLNSRAPLLNSQNQQGGFSENCPNAMENCLERSIDFSMISVDGNKSSCNCCTETLQQSLDSLNQTLQLLSQGISTLLEQRK